MEFPLSTGQVVQLLQTPEHRVLQPIRLGKVAVLNIGNRRLWYPKDVLAVARIVGKDSPKVRNFCNVKITPPTKINGGGA